MTVEEANKYLSYSGLDKLRESVQKNVNKEELEYPIDRVVKKSSNGTIIEIIFSLFEKMLLER